MEPRMAKALHIAATSLLRSDDLGRWQVPSQSGRGNYVVAAGMDLAWQCDCPDFTERLAPCKHILSVQVTIQREQGAQVAYTTEVKVTYSQDWPRYNLAATNEKPMVLSLLSNLCSLLPEPEHVNGRPPLTPATLAFASVHKVYEQCSARRFDADIQDAFDKGLILQKPAFNSVLKGMRNPAMTPVLSDLVSLSALPLRSIEREFAVDSTGFGARRLRTWYSKKHGKEMSTRDWRKLHASVGTSTHVITAAEVTDPTANDAPYLPELVKRTAKGFIVNEVSADKGYSSKANTAEIEELGATPFIPFKSNTVVPDPGTAWARMWGRFTYQRDEFMDRYHRRSNVESTFGMIKARFGDQLFSTSPEGQTNEVYAKCIAHNLVCLTFASHELGIESDFESLVVA